MQQFVGTRYRRGEAGSAQAPQPSIAIALYWPLVSMLMSLNFAEALISGRGRMWSELNARRERARG
jgi:hypothetical protein